jgi:riboflavin biosynthesis pyrimidine reductase
MVEFARIWRDMPKVVFSRTLQRADLAGTFRKLDLIDEYRLYVHPVLLGGGTPLFRAADAPARLHLLESRAFGNGVVLLRYERPARVAG